MLLLIFLLLVSISFLLLILSFHPKFTGLPAALFSIFAGIMFLFLMYEAFNIQISSIELGATFESYKWVNQTVVYQSLFAENETFRSWEWVIDNVTVVNSYNLETKPYAGDYIISMYFFALGLFSIIKGFLYDIVLKFIKDTGGK